MSQVTDPATGISLRFIKQWDITKDVAPQKHDTFVLGPYDQLMMHGLHRDGFFIVVKRDPDAHLGAVET